MPYRKNLYFGLWYHLNRCPSPPRLCSSALIVTSLFDVNSIICHYANVRLWMSVAYNSVMGSWIPAVEKKMPANSSTCRSCGQRKREQIDAPHSTVTFMPYLQETKSFSGCSFNEGIVGQFCNYWHRNSLKKKYISECIYWSLTYSCEWEDLLSDKMYRLVRHCFLIDVFKNKHT